MARPSSHLDLPKHILSADTLMHLYMSDIAKSPRIAHMVTAILIEVETTDGLYYDGNSIRRHPSGEELDRNLGEEQSKWDDLLQSYQEACRDQTPMSQWKYDSLVKFVREEGLDPLPDDCKPVAKDPL